MPVLSFEAEYSGRPIVDLYVGMGSEDARALREAGGHPPVLLVVKALVDTGATRSQVDLSILEQIGLGSVGDVEFYTASSGMDPEKARLYVMDLHLAGDKPGTLAKDLRVIGSDMLAGLNVGMLLGRDILDRCLLVYDGLHRRFTLAYDAPDHRPEE
jgi:hypothetical protein